VEFLEHKIFTEKLKTDFTRNDFW